MAAGNGTPADRPMLICYDGSRDARRAIMAAADLLVRRPAVVLDVTPAVTAEEHEAAFLTPGPDSIELRVRDVRRVAHRGALLARAQGLEATGRIAVAGQVWKAVVQIADDVDASVIVVGSRRADEAHEVLDGSLSHDIARHAGRPLLVVPPARS